MDRLDRSSARSSVAASLVVALSLVPGLARGQATAPPSDDRIVYQMVPVTTGHHHAVISLLAVPVQASDGRPLVGEELYLKLGRPDLVEALHSRRIARAVVAGLGATAAVGGLVYFATRPGPDTSMSFDQFSRAMNDQSRAQVTGAMVSLGGMVVAFSALFIDPEPVSDVELHRLIEVHNQGLAAAPPHAEAARDAGPEVSLQAAPIPGGGMVGLAVAF
jgi:hypothetical protein